MTFNEWVEKEKFLKRFDGFAPTLTDLVMIAREAWNASRANMVEPEPEDPTPTEMVKRLIEKGWTIQQGLHDEDEGIMLFDTVGTGYSVIQKAYRKAFPKKVKREVEVYQSPDGRVRDYRYYREIPQGDITLPWTKGTATFWVPEEE